MNRTALAFKGSVIGVISQIITLLLKLFVRTLFIRFLGREILGLDSVLVDLIGMLSLAELGITSAMLFHIYTPIIKKDKKMINKLMASYKVIYRYIAFAVLVIGIIIGLFLPYFIRGLSIEWKYIYLCYSLLVINSICSYLMSYQRILLNADQKTYLVITADLISSILFTFIQVAALFFLKSYAMFIIILILQTLFSNLILFFYTKKYYSFVNSKTKASISDLKLILSDAKDVMGGKVAGYVYNSTDNIVISIIMGTSIVGNLSNYRYVVSAMKTLVNSAMSAIQPIIGNYLNSDTDKTKSYRILQQYTFVRFLIAGFTVIPFISSINDFILIWTGDKTYVLSIVIPILFSIEYYIGCVYGSFGEYLLGLGEFKAIKNIQLLGAGTNIIFSIVGSIVFGISGVLLGTSLSQLIIYIGYFRLLFNGYFSALSKTKKKFIRMQFLYFLIIVISVFTVNFLNRYLFIESLVIKIIVKSVIGEVVFFLIVSSLILKSDDLRFVLKKLHF
ncbi:oligosaccharide flippase family protein [Enterococcus italicus]|uniref:oligosaccharide flippase family protein n=1 Tax=Enterococcus italicus TaxID=246144 RepID=UPI003F48C93A